MPTSHQPTRASDSYAARREAHVDSVGRALKRHEGQIAASHESAAIALGLATYDIPRRPRLTRTSGSRRNGRATKIAVADLRDTDVRFVGGIWVTSPAWTVIEIARSRPFMEALVTADAALRAGVRRDELEQLLARMHRWPGIRSATEVVRWADPRAETPLESIIRGRCIVLDLPLPELQWRIKCRNGCTYWCDFYWQQWGLVGEADGRTKYDGPDGAEVLWREKQRRDDIEEVRFVTRWTWAQAHVSDDVFRTRLLAALDRAARYMRALDPGPGGAASGG